MKNKNKKNEELLIFHFKNCCAEELHSLGYSTTDCQHNFCKFIMHHILKKKSVSSFCSLTRLCGSRHLDTLAKPIGFGSPSRLRTVNSALRFAIPGDDLRSQEHLWRDRCHVHTCAVSYYLSLHLKDSPVSSAPRRILELMPCRGRKSFTGVEGKLSKTFLFSVFCVLFLRAHYFKLP